MWKLFVKHFCHTFTLLFLRLILIGLCRTMTRNVSRYAQDFLVNSNVNWWKTPAESPDLNPIENLWHELKEYIRRVVKPKTKDELVNGILAFWATVDVAKCRKYIRHLKKVIPRVIELEGQATGY